MNKQQLSLLIKELISISEGLCETACEKDITDQQIAVLNVNDRLLDVIRTLQNHEQDMEES